MKKPAELDFDFRHERSQGAQRLRRELPGVSRTDANRHPTLQHRTFVLRNFRCPPASACEPLDVATRERDILLEEVNAVEPIIGFHHLAICRLKRVEIPSAVRPQLTHGMVRLADKARMGRRQGVDFRMLAQREFVAQHVDQVLDPALRDRTGEDHLGNRVAGDRPLPKPIFIRRRRFGDVCTSALIADCGIRSRIMRLSELRVDATATADVDERLRLISGRRYHLAPIQRSRLFRLKPMIQLPTKGAGRTTKIQTKAAAKKTPASASRLEKRWFDPIHNAADNASHHVNATVFLARSRSRCSTRSVPNAKAAHAAPATKLGTNNSRIRSG